MEKVKAVKSNLDRLSYYAYKLTDVYFKDLYKEEVPPETIRKIQTCTFKIRDAMLEARTYLTSVENFTSNIEECPYLTFKELCDTIKEISATLPGKSL